MTIEHQIKDEKLQYDTNREAAKISALSSGKLDKYEYLTGEEILPSNQQQIIQQAKFNYSPLGKVFEKQRKTIEDQGEKQVKAIQDNQLVNIKNYDYKNKLLFSKEREIFKDIYNKKLDEIDEMNNKIDYNDLEYVDLSNDMAYNFSVEKDPISLLNDITSGKTSLKEAKDAQENYHHYLNIIRKGNKNDTQKRTLANIKMFYNARDNAIKIIEDYCSMILDARRLAEEQKGTGANEMSERLKILTPNQMLKRLPIALAQVKAGNNSESLLNEIRQIVYSLYRSKEITKKVYNNIKYKHNTKMDTIFMSSENSKTSEHVLVLKLTDKSDIRRGQKTVALSNLSIYYTWKNVKSSYNNNKFKISAPTWSEDFKLSDGSYSVSDIQDYFEYILKKHSESVDNPSIRMYVNRIENRITFKIKNGYYLEFLTPETMKLLGSTESKITKDKNGENVPHLEIVELVLVR